jgi:hypothetical protein
MSWLDGLNYFTEAVGCGSGVVGVTKIMDSNGFVDRRKRHPFQKVCPLRCGERAIVLKTKRGFALLLQICYKRLKIRPALVQSLLNFHAQARPSLA